MGGSHGGEADEKTRAFVRAELEVRNNHHPESSCQSDLPPAAIGL